MSTVFDVVTVVLVLAGAIVALVAALGVVLLRDARTAMHAATKPATLSVLLIGSGAVLQLDNLSSVSKLIVIIALQFVTAPVGAHMLSRGISSDTDPSDDTYN
jgi:multicomponent Na+:H+ antiporter subunit G